MKIPSDTNPNHRIRLQAIAEALSVIDPVFLNSPQYECEPLSAAVGCQLTLKIETANPIRSFKGRGGGYLVKSRYRSGAFSGRRIVGASAGNWGQALAYACRAIGQPITIFASVNANPLKIELMRNLGADMVLQGDDFDAAKLAARAFARETNAVQLEDGLDVEASEGAGTIAVELMQLPISPDVVLVPLGNGAMLTGMARWIKSVRPATLVIGVQSAGADAMEKSWRYKKIVEAGSVNTIADGIGVRIPVPEAVADMEGLVDDVILVDDKTIVTAMTLLHQKAGLMVEPSGAAGVAALLENKARFEGARVATVICGGNLTEQQVRQYLFLP